MLAGSYMAIDLNHVAWINNISLRRGHELTLQSEQAAVSVWSLSIYFILTFLYFNRDSSKTVVPAIRRRGWRLPAWVL